MSDTPTAQPLADPETVERARWAHQTVGPTPDRDPATDDRMRSLYFVGGPWGGQTKYRRKLIAAPDQALFVFEQAGAWRATFSAEYEGDARGRYQPTGVRGRTLMIWHVPGAPDPGTLVLQLSNDDPYDRLALGAIHERAREAAGIAAAYGDEGLVHGINAAARPLVAAALHKLTAALPGITDDQVQWLDETAAALDLSAVENLTGANGNGLDDQEPLDGEEEWPPR